MYRVFHNFADNTRGQIEQIKLSRKILYHFAISVIVNRTLLKIVKYWFSIIFYLGTINFTEKQQVTKIINFFLIEF